MDNSAQRNSDAAQEAAKVNQETSELQGESSIQQEGCKVSASTVCCASDFGGVRAVLKEVPSIPPEDINWWEALKIIGETTKEQDEFVESEKARLKAANLLPDLKDFTHLRESMLS